MTRKDIDNIILTICPNDEDFEKPIISPKYLKTELEQLALEQEPCEDCVNRQAVLDGLASIAKAKAKSDAQKSLMGRVMFFVEQTSSVKSKIGHCRNCKYFEYDSVAKVDGIPLIVAHEICSRWGDGCKTKEDGYCFLFEQKMQEGGAE